MAVALCWVDIHPAVLTRSRTGASTPPKTPSSQNEGHRGQQRAHTTEDDNRKLQCERSCAGIKHPASASVPMDHQVREVLLMPGGMTRNSSTLTLILEQEDFSEERRKLLAL